MPQFRRRIRSLWCLAGRSPNTPPLPPRLLRLLPFRPSQPSLDVITCFFPFSFPVSVFFLSFWIMLAFVDFSSLFGWFCRCKRLNRLVLHPLVLSKAGPKAFAVRMEKWCDSAHRFLKRCVDAGNSEASYTLGMVCSSCSFVLKILKKLILCIWSGDGEWWYLCFFPCRSDFIAWEIEGVELL